MQKNQMVIVGLVSIAAIAIVAVLIGNSQTSLPGGTNMRTVETMMNQNSNIIKEETKTATSQQMMPVEEVIQPVSGQYLPYSLDSLTGEQNVIFFAANWCPTCRRLDGAIMSALGEIPASLTILKADYDKETALKRKYGVTYQHTLVQVDKQGNLLKKWNGSENISAIVSQLN